MMKNRCDMLIVPVLADVQKPNIAKNVFVRYNN